MHTSLNIFLSFLEKSSRYSHYSGDSAFFSNNCFLDIFLTDALTLQNGPQSPVMTYFITYSFIYHDNILSASCGTVPQKSFFITVFLHLTEMKGPRGCSDCPGWRWAEENEPRGNNFTSQFSCYETQALCTNKSPWPSAGLGGASTICLGRLLFHSHLMACPEPGYLSFQRAAPFHTLHTTVLYVF